MDTGTSDIVRMANQIADFFKSYSYDEAVKGVAEHINRFWEPRMRAQLFRLLAKGGDGLSPIVREAAAQIHKPKPAAA